MSIGQTKAAPNAAERIARALVVQILRGEHTPGTRLPTVRSLAQRFGVNPSTIQRALARLEGTGLVDVEHGSGIEVLAPGEHADLSLLPEWLLARLDSPSEARALLGGYLELRRQLVARQLSRFPLNEWPTVEPVVARWREASGQGVEAFAAADLALFRALAVHGAHPVHALVFNTARRLLLLVPEVAEAMYAKPQENLQRFAELLPELTRMEHAQVRERLIEDALAEVDARTLRRFVRLLRKRLKESHA